MDAAGTRICNLAALDETGCYEFPLDQMARDTGFLVRRGAAVHGYANACAHLGVPLNLTGNNFLDAERSLLICAMHGALFRPEDGYCVAGPCAGESLRRLPIAVRDGAVWLLPPER